VEHETKFLIWDHKGDQGRKGVRTYGRCPRGEKLESRNPEAATKMGKIKTRENDRSKPSSCTIFVRGTKKGQATPKGAHFAQGVKVREAVITTWVICCGARGSLKAKKNVARQTQKVQGCLQTIEDKMMCKIVLGGPNRKKKRSRCNDVDGGSFTKDPYIF